MDKAQAIQGFWSQFGIPAYDANTVPKDATMPYITYNLSTGKLGDVLPMNASLWYQSYSWDDISKKAELIAHTIGYGYQISKIDGGYIWITQGSPFAQRMADPDSDVRRIYINVMAEYLTAY